MCVENCCTCGSYGGDCSLALQPMSEGDHRTALNIISNIARSTVKAKSHQYLNKSLMAEWLEQASQ